jgi:uncharacterized membrane protein YkoI
MKPISLSAAMLVVLAAGATAATPGAANFRGHQLAGHAHISLDRARAIAQKARPGIFTDQVLDKEAGGSGLRYSFDILSAHKIYEVGVDAKTGKILENGVESAAEGAVER